MGLQARQRFVHCQQVLTRLFFHRLSDLQRHSLEIATPLYLLFGVLATHLPIWASAAMSLSSLSVVANSLRLRGAAL